MIILHFYWYLYYVDIINIKINESLYVLKSIYFMNEAGKYFSLKKRETERNRKSSSRRRIALMG